VTYFLGQASDREENIDNQERLRAIFYGLREVNGEILVMLLLHSWTRVGLDGMGMTEEVKDSIILVDPIVG
jgi:hypothetical protein